MHNRYEESRKQFFTVSLVLILLLVVFCCIISLSFAKYAKNMSTVSTGTVARAVVVIGGLEQGENSYTLNLKDMNPTKSTAGLAEDYDFFVANGIATTFSEVAIRYNIFLTTTGYLPLDISLKDNANESIISLTPGTNNGVASNTYSFTAGAHAVHQYSILVSWNSGAGNDGSDYAGLIDLLTIRVAWEQIN